MSNLSIILSSLSCIFLLGFVILLLILLLFVPYNHRFLRLTIVLFILVYVFLLDDSGSDKLFSPSLCFFSLDFLSLCQPFTLSLELINLILFKLLLCLFLSPNSLLLFFLFPFSFFLNSPPFIFLSLQLGISLLLESLLFSDCISNGASGTTRSALFALLCFASRGCNWLFISCLNLSLCLF